MSRGSVYRQRPGLWAAAITTAPGKRRVYYGKSRREVEAKLNAALHEQSLGILPASGKETIAELLGTWLEQAARPKVRPKTYATYRYLVERHLVPALGGIRAEKLR